MALCFASIKSACERVVMWCAAKDVVSRWWLWVLQLLTDSRSSTTTRRTHARTHSQYSSPVTMHGALARHMGAEIVACPCETSDTM